MFSLSTFYDSLPVDPSDFNKDYTEHLKTIIQDKYVDRVCPLDVVQSEFINIRSL